MVDNAIVSWWGFVNDANEAEGIEELTMWNAGTLVAGEESAEKKFIIWNNKGGSQDVPNMSSCELRTVDSDGGLSSPLVKDRWVKVSFPIGAEPFPIGSKWVESKQDYDPVSITIQGTNTSAGMIEGKANDGTMDTLGNEKNYAKFEAILAPPETAGAGLTQAKFRVEYRIG